MKTIAHFLSSDIKINQDFKYRQITNLTKYRSIVFGEYAVRDSEQEYPYEYFYIGDITDWPSFFSEQNIKAIHAHSGGDANKILPLALLHNLPLVVSFRGNDASAQKTAKKKNQLKYQELIKDGSLFLPVCTFFKMELIKLGFPKEKIKVMFGGIDIHKFAFQKFTPNKDQTFRILSIGRLVKKKGFPTLIKAFSEVNKKFPKAKLIIVGEGEPEQWKIINKQIKKYNLEHALELYNETKNDDIVTELHRADLFCLPSYTTNKGAVEGIPNVLKEAMACGIPVVSTFHAGIPELIQHKKSGILVKEKDVEALASAIIKLLKNPKRSKQYAKRARQKVTQDFNLNKQIVVQEQNYDDLLLRSESMIDLNIKMDGKL